MDYNQAIDEILELASRIKPPGRRLDVVTIVEREFAKQGYCNFKFIELIEQVLRQRIQQWSRQQKREIWQSTEIGLQHRDDFECYTPDSIDMDLESELLHYLGERLSPATGEKDTERDDDDDSEF